ncbi:sulfur oxidation c-type cytochrome SoxX [Oricola cellulosilytica]|uniref:Sulfur oxidation c-type cytochrome SoxX n=1 Tax=Oricola cellulosilytica TaxID=1429082 RepID=A0A4R0P7S2_9HYPH|nr:sulfur oxidation c-type cytochrome SoxX [Oricola cellulosilytica]TCD11954.1 sulfur oxidation c-type cytochrome SoxX [Oricola cellulosilytica]
MKFTIKSGLASALVLLASTAFAASVVAPGDVAIEDGAVSKSLTGAPGDAAEGRKTFADRKLGNCLACHAVTDQSEQLFHGEVGPPLDGVGDRWSEAELRAILVNSKAIFSEDTIMPGFYTLDVGVDVREDLVGKTILTAEQVEDVVAYLITLKE